MVIPEGRWRDERRTTIKSRQRSRPTLRHKRSFPDCKRAGYQCHGRLRKSRITQGYKAKLTILKEAARTLNYLTENNLLQYADLEKKVEDVHSSYDRTGKDLKGVEARLREVQPLIKNISNYQRLKPVYDAFQKAKDKPSFKAKHEAELVIFEAARSTLLAMQGDEKLPSLKTLQAEQQRLLEEQQRLYDERAKLKKEARMIDTLKANVDDFLKPNAERDQEHQRNSQRE